MSDLPATRLACAACGAAPDARAPWRCPNAGRDNLDHIVARRLDAARATFPRAGAANPFVRFRTLLHSYHAARAGGMSDADYVTLVEELDRAVAAVDGHGFAGTPFARSAALSDALGFAPAGGAWVKDETGNVSGSHKARHLFGIALVLEVMERTGLASRAEHDRRGLAIASCGNAALAAAVVARAARRPLQVFIPPDADPRVVERLKGLGARIAVCPRAPGEMGDPCVHAFRRALDAGALPFCCQGSDNGLTIEGGETLAWEMAAALADEGLTLDRLFVQVGGGALASACVQGLREAVSLGALARLPRLHAVQTFGAFPLRRAYERVRARFLTRLGGAGEAGGAAAGSRTAGVGGAEDAAAAGRMRAPDAAGVVREELRHAQAHRSEFMWAWEEPPRSIAHGILDDETYDWHAVVTGMIESGGWPVTVSEEGLAAANALARSATGIRVDHTGSSGLAGLIELQRTGLVAPGETVAVLFTGVQR